MSKIERELASDEVLVEAVGVHEIVSAALDIVQVLDLVLSTGERSYRVSRKQMRVIRNVMRRTARASAQFYELSSRLDELLSESFDASDDQDGNEQQPPQCDEMETRECPANDCAGLGCARFSREAKDWTAAETNALKNWGK
jgi:hypothetical protein